MSTGNLDIIRDHYAASARGDLEGMLAAFAPDIAWTEVAGFPYAGTYHGAAAIVANVFARIGAEWEGFRGDTGLRRRRRRRRLPPAHRAEPPEPDPTPDGGVTSG